VKGALFVFNSSVRFFIVAVKSLLSLSSHSSGRVKEDNRLTFNMAVKRFQLAL
jgi:hypothetical protein